MRRESHVRFCEGVGVQYPSATRRAPRTALMLRRFIDNNLRQQPCCTRDGGGPPGIGLQGQVSNRLALRRPKTWVVSGPRKGRARPCQVWIRKTNESEPLMRRRKGMNAIETRPRMKAWDEVRKEPAYGPDGGRRKGGVSLIQALVWNVGIVCPDAKGEAREVVLRRARLPMRDAEADRFVVAVRPGNAGGAKEPACPAFDVGQPEGVRVHV